MKMFVIQFIFFIILLILIKLFFKVLKLMQEIEINYDEKIRYYKEISDSKKDKVIDNNKKIDIIESEILAYKKKLKFPLFETKQ